MSQERLAPQQPEECLTQSRKSRYKGGTLIAAEVWTVEEHRRRLRDPQRPYRPRQCPKCRGQKLDVHDYRERHPQGIRMVAVLIVARFICVNPKCRATWRVLPAFLARHLWWPWQEIEAVISAAAAVPVVPSPTSATESGTATAPVTHVALAERNVIDPLKKQKARAPAVRTRQRWQERLRASARQLVQLLAKRGGAVLQAVAQSVGLDADRIRLVQCYAGAMGLEAGRRLASLGAKVHEIERGIRLM